jgi:hypothetical protein
LHKLDYYQCRFFWQGDNEKKKYRLAKWSVVCSPKDQGGLGIHDLEVKNIALLGKRLFKLLMEEGTWQTILKMKYIGQKVLCQVLWKLGDSHFGLDSWQRRSFSLAWILFPLRMVWRYGSGKTNGLVILLFGNSDKGIDNRAR